MRSDRPRTRTVHVRDVTAQGGRKEKEEVLNHVEKAYLQRRASQPETRRPGRHSGLKRARQRPVNKPDTEQTSPRSHVETFIGHTVTYSTVK